MYTHIKVLFFANQKLPQDRISLRFVIDKAQFPQTYLLSKLLWFKETPLLDDDSKTVNSNKQNSSTTKIFIVKFFLKTLHDVRLSITC